MFAARFESSPTVQYTPELHETMQLELQRPTFDAVRPTRPRRVFREDVPPMPEDWRDVERVARLGRSQSLIGLRTPPLVGREALRDELWDGLMQVRSGRTTSVTLRCKSGTGKSRLASWICGLAHEAGAARHLVLRHDAKSVSRDVLVDSLAHSTGCEGLGVKEQRARLRLLFAEDEEFPEWAIDTLSGAFRQGEDDAFALNRGLLSAAINALFARWTADRPLILWVDDVQWADASADLLLPLKNSGMPILFLSTLQLEAYAERTENGALNRWIEQSSSFELDPLSEDEIASLYDQILVLSPDARERLVHRVDGNPLFALQLLGDLVDRGLLVEEGRRLKLEENVELLLPESLGNVWSRRIERLLVSRSRDDALALEVASLLGGTVSNTVWMGVLATLGIHPSPGLVNDLAKERLAEQQTGAWSFVHGMLRDSVRNRCEDSRAVAFHLAIGDWYWQSDDAMAGPRAIQHWAEGEAFERVLSTSLSVVRVLAEWSAFAEAEFVLALHDVAADILDRPVMRARGWAEAAVIASSRSELNTADDLISRARLVATENPDPELVAHTRLAESRVHYMRGQMPQAKECVEYGVAVLDERQIAVPIWVRRQYADTLAYMSEFVAAMRAYEVGRDAAREAPATGWGSAFRLRHRLDSLPER